jgi:hypothetical protein
MSKKIYNIKAGAIYAKKKIHFAFIFPFRDEHCIRETKQNKNKIKQNKRHG